MMPALARLYIRTALAYLLIGTVLGGLLLWNKGMPIAPRMWLWLSPHIGLVNWGWLWHLTFGVAFWILPRFHGSRGKIWLVWLAYACLNTGILAAALAPLVPGPWPSALFGLFQLLAAVAFAVHAWPRVKPAGA